jgi:two-component system nitrogen regulation response regulator GlnG
MSQSSIADVSTAVGATRPGEPADRVLALTIVSHPFSQRAGEQAVFELVEGGREVTLTRNAPDFVRPGKLIGVPLDDPFVSRKPIRFAAAPGGGVKVNAEAGGTPVFAGTLIDGSTTFTAEELAHGAPLELAQRVVLLLHMVDRVADNTSDLLSMVGASSGLRRVRLAIERLADLAVPVLIRGETGTGKELVARAIHDRSPRRAGPFISVNLGAIPRELAAAELFGSTRGAFTGARDRDGLFRAAHGGTLFLDEVGEAPPEVQVTLLRVLETSEIFPVGGDKPVAVQVRLIAATDANLEDQIRSGQFKAPLLHRLAGYEVRMPPLRERREDIGPLFYHFAREELSAIGEGHRLSPQDPYARPWLPAHLAAQLVRYPWPGNIRELRNVTRQLVIESRGLSQLRIDPRLSDQLGIVAGSSNESLPTRHPSDPALDRQLPAEPSSERRRPSDPSLELRRKASDVAEAELIDALRASAWDLKAAADRLRIPRPSIYDLIDRNPNIRIAGDLSPEEIEQAFHTCGGDIDAMVPLLQVSKRALTRRLRELGLASRTRGRSSAEPDGHD